MITIHIDEPDMTFIQMRNLLMAFGDIADEHNVTILFEGKKKDPMAQAVEQNAEQVRRCVQ